MLRSVNVVLTAIRLLVIKAPIIVAMKATFDHSKKEAANIRTFFFKPARPMDYTAGQYTELTLKHNHPDERGIKHWFTLSSPPGRQLVTITTKYAGDGNPPVGGSTFKKTLFHLEPGIEVDLAEAMGDFVLPKDPSIPLVFVAGGIGLTPFHSMFEWLADQSTSRNITFIYGVRSEDEIIFEETFERADVHATIVAGEPTDAWGGESGRLSAEMILGLAKPADNALVYMSGPEPMIEALEKDMLASGVHKRQLVTDFFPGYTNL